MRPTQQTIYSRTKDVTQRIEAQTVKQIETKINLTEAHVFPCQVSTALNQGTCQWWEGAERAVVIYTAKQARAGQITWG